MLVSALKWQVVGQFATQAFRVASNLILTRLLVPEAFGLMGMVQIFITSVELFSDIGLRGSVIHHERGESREFLNTVWTIQVIRGWLLFLVTCLGTYPFAVLYDMPELLFLLPITGFSTAVRGFSSTSVLLAIRKLDLRWTVTVDFLAMIIGNLAMIAIALWTRSVVALALGWNIAQMAYVWLSFQQKNTPRNHFHWDRDAARSIINFGRFSFLSSGIMIILIRADRMALGKLISTSDLGSYVIGSNLAMMPMIIFDHINAKLLQPTFAKLNDLPDARAKVRKLRFGVLMIHLPFLVLLVLLGQPIVDLMYPPQLARAGWYCSLIGLAAMLRVGTDPGPVFPARGDAKTHLYLMIARAFAVIFSMLIGYFIGLQYGTEINGLVFGMVFAPLLSYPFEAFHYKRIHVWIPEVDAIGMVTTCFCTLLLAFLYG